MDKEKPNLFGTDYDVDYEFTDDDVVPYMEKPPKEEDNDLGGHS